MSQEFNDSSNITPTNKMNGKFIIYGKSDSWLESSLISRAISDDSISASFIVKSFKSNDLNSSFKLMYRNESTLSAYLVSNSASILNAYLNIRPHNQMNGLFEIVEPPRVTDKINPIQDSTTRSLSDYKYLNYGQSSQMLVGNDKGDIQRAFIQFDFSNYIPPLAVEKAKIRLYYNGTFLNKNTLRLGLADRKWFEKGITDANRPLISKVISNTYEINTVNQYIEFDIYDTVQQFINGTVENNGFIIESIDNANGLSDVLFTRESHRPPELNITYFDTRVWTANKSELTGTLFTHGAGLNDLNSFFTLHTDYDHRDLNATLQIHRYDTPVYTDNKAFVNVSSPELNSTMRVYRLSENELNSTLTIQRNQYDHLNAGLSISNPELRGKLFTKYSDTLDSVFTIRGHIDNDLTLHMTVNNPEINTRMIVRTFDNSDLNAILRIEQGENSDLNTYINISRPELVAKLITKVRKTDDLNSVLYIQRRDVDVLQGQLAISTPELRGSLIAEIANSINGTLYIQHPELKSEMIIRAYADNDLNARFRPRIMNVDDLNSYVKVINKKMVKSYFYIL